MFIIYVDASGTRAPLVEINTPTLSVFLAQIAASLLAAAKSYPRDGTIPEADPVGSILDIRMRWAPHGFTNGLVSQAELLYQVVHTSVAMGRPTPNIMSEELALLITDALAVFQEWKTDLIRAQKEEFGESWGDATSFNQMDYTDQSEEFLRFWPTREEDDEIS